MSTAGQKRKAGPAGADSDDEGGKARRRPADPHEAHKQQLEKLFERVDKPINLPKSARESSPSLKPPPEFVRNVSGSSAGAGSGDFHVYRALRRKEQARVKTLEEETSKEAEQREYELKLAKMREEQEARTAKKRAKRQKKKGKQGKKPAGKPGTGLGEDESEDEGDGASEAGSEGSPAVNRDEGAPDNSKEAGARETAGTGQSEADDRPVPKITRAPPSLPLELEPQGEVKRMEPNVKIIEDDDM